jgi:glutathione synthase/RimK-type ligase-like ATP-grasp enzyme
VESATQPTLGIFRERRDIDEFVFKAPQYEQAYYELYRKLQMAGLQLVLLMGQSSYVGGNRFSRHWQVVHSQNPKPKFVPAGAIEPDLILVKDELKFDAQARTLNDQKIIELAANKQATYELLGQFQPKTEAVINAAEFKFALNKIPSTLVAVKGFYGNSGEAVFVGAKSDIKPQTLPWPVQVQEFVDTSGGIPGLVEGSHDLRIILANGQPILGKIRTPPAWGLKSNIGYGGKSWLVSVAQLPKAAVSLAYQIDEKLTKLSPWRLYSIDLGLSPEGWKLFELNDKPGVVDLAQGEPAKNYQKDYVDFLVDATKWYAKRK